MAAGARGRTPPGSYFTRDAEPGRPADQRTRGREAYRLRAGTGLMSVQDDEEGAWLKYLAELTRTGQATPRTEGFQRVRRGR
jgi:hypothetical protein